MNDNDIRDARKPAAIGGPAARFMSALNATAMLSLAIMWGLSIPITKLGLLEMPPLTLTALRFAIAVPLLLILVLGKKRLARRALLPVAALGVLGISVGQVAQAFGVAGTSASVGTVISATIPVFVVVFAAMRLKQHVSAWQHIGLIAAFAGIAAVAFGQDGGDGNAVAQTSAIGVIWMLVSAVSIAFYYVWSLELTQEYGTAVVAAWSTLFGFIALLPFAGWEMSRVSFQITLQGMIVAAYLGIVVTVVGLFLWLYLLRTVPARVAASVQYLQPVIGVAAAAFMFGDALGPLFAAGVVLILIGLGLAAAPSKKIVASEE